MIAVAIMWGLLVGFCIGAVTAFYVVVIRNADKPQPKEQRHIDFYA